MKYTKILLVVFLLCCFSANAQILNPVKWQTKIEKKSNTEYWLTFEAIIEKDWHLYSQFTPEGGPLPLELSFPDSKNYKLVGKASESKTASKFNETFGVNETFFEGKAQIRQLVKIMRPGAPIQVELDYQVCKQVCIPQKKYFEFDTKNLKSKAIKHFTKNTFAKAIAEPMS